jgi:6-phosphogluconolactonase
METSSSHGQVLAYLGTYTGAASEHQNGEGIYCFEVNPRTGELANRRLAASTPNPSWLALHPSRRFLYAANEIENYTGGGGSVSAFAVDRATGDLRPLNTVASGGASPAHISLDATGQWAFVANYAGGAVAVLPVHDDGSLGEAVCVRNAASAAGGTHAAAADSASAAGGGHPASHAHMIQADLDNRFVIATDLGQDRIYSYRLHPATGQLTPVAAQPIFRLPPGAGPRHFVFHPNRRWLYSLQEAASTVAFFRYDSSQGRLRFEQTISALPPGFTGANFSSHVALGPSGRVLYAANRLHDAISVFTIGADGELAFLGESPTMGGYPRSFAIEPSGRFLFACNQHTDNITCFRIGPDDGLLHFTGQAIPAPTPACLLFLA